MISLRAAKKLIISGVGMAKRGVKAVGLAHSSQVKQIVTLSMASSK